MKKYNILAVSPPSIGGRLTMNSIFDGFETLGHNIFVFDEIYQSKEEFLSLINQNQFDFILGYDFSPVKLKIDNNLKTPCVCYFSDVIEDNHSGKYWGEYYQYLKNPDIFVFYWDKKLCEKKKETGEIANLCYLPHFVNTEVYKNLGLKEEYKIMFAGRLDTDFRLQTVVDLMKTSQKDGFGWFASKKHFEDAIQRMPSQKELITSCYKGFIDNEEDMAVAINKTKMVINFNAQGESSLNYRAMQTLACEKLLLNDVREEIKALFPNNKVMECFSDIEDLKNKINYYLNDEKNYRQITSCARKAMHEGFSSKVGVQKMINFIEKTS